MFYFKSSCITLSTFSRFSFDISRAQDNSKLSRTAFIVNISLGILGRKCSIVWLIANNRSQLFDFVNLHNNPPFCKNIRSIGSIVDKNHSKYIQRKSVEPVCHSLHNLKALALPDKSKRATLKAPRKCEYITYSPNEHVNIRMVWNSI